MVFWVPSHQVRHQWARIKELSYSRNFSGNFAKNPLFINYQQEIHHMLGISANILTHRHPKPREWQRTDNNPGGGTISCSVQLKNETPFLTTKHLKEMQHTSQGQSGDASVPLGICFSSLSSGEIVWCRILMESFRTECKLSLKGLRLKAN